LATMETISIPRPLPAQARTVLIADDHVLVRDGIRLLVAGILGQADFLEASDGPSLLHLVQTHRNIDLALVDLNMPGMDKGFRLLELARLPRCPPLIVVSALTSPDVVRRTLVMPRVLAFVPKSATSAHMRQAIEAALQGVKLPFTPSLDAGSQPEVRLTPRLEEVRALLRQGMSNKLIASTLGISEGTVKNHMTEIFRALNVSNRTQAARHNPEIQ
jgi:DNA-binding NarL/FixJ family response regulator